MLDNLEIIYSPMNFFKTLDKKTFKDAFWWSVIISYIGSTLLLLIPEGSASAFIGAIFAAIGMIIGIFIFAAIVHIFVAIFSGKLEFSDTYKIVSFSSTVFILLLWTMPLVLIFQIWSYVLIIMGIVDLHKKRTKK